MLEQELIPVTPVITQLANPTPFVGVVPPDGPVTAAVKVIVDPSDAVPALAVTTTVGVTFETAVVDELFTKATEL